ncbi:MAG: lytic murein transglycosylase, partial [Phototrophicales bacterium]
IARGQNMYKKYRSVLEKVGREYGVQPQYIVALWGIETYYGTYTGGFGVVEALATLAFDGRRSQYFRGELLDALSILDDGHIKVADMKGSWAGAMGQCQ